MIIIGYQGIGKSSLAKKYLRVIDLDSSTFKLHGKRVRSPEWPNVYCNVAESLSQQDYVVMVSSHSAVQDRLLSSKEYVAAIYPEIGLKNFWLDRLQTRFEATGTEKDMIAYLDAVNNFDQEIKKLRFTKFSTNIGLTDENYNLEKIVMDLRGESLWNVTENIS